MFYVDIKNFTNYLKANKGDFLPLEVKVIKGNSCYNLSSSDELKLIVEDNGVEVINKVGTYESAEGVTYFDIDSADMDLDEKKYNMYFILTFADSNTVKINNIKDFYIE